MQVSSLSSLPSLTGARAEQLSSPGSGTEGFSQLVSSFLGSVSQADSNATQAVQQMAAGQAEDLHQVTLAVTQADLSFRLALEIRNRVTEAYQEVMRMQV